MSIQSSSKRIRISNENATVYECKTCSKVFSRSKSYNDHIRLIHSKKVQDGATSVVDELAATEGKYVYNKCRLLEMLKQF
ncbi:hypothetical protein BDB01DRAFT_821894 [Pilobolus umbonatus]|nr:hypothetical protein BDB01DRAFT_821894 [Pilobolus umbonatus]